jgi:hypothetical protein
MRLIIFALILLISFSSFATIILQESFDTQNPFPPIGWTQIVKTTGQYAGAGWYWHTGSYADGEIQIVYDSGSALAELRTPIFVNVYGEQIHISFKFSTSTTFYGSPAFHHYRFIVYKNQNEAASAGFPDQSPWTTYDQTFTFEQNAKYFLGFRLDKPYQVDPLIVMSFLIDDILIESIGSNMMPVETATLGKMKAIYL